MAQAQTGGNDRDDQVQNAGVRPSAEATGGPAPPLDDPDARTRGKAADQALAERGFGDHQGERI